jgi:hypothetical protein
MAPDRYAIIYNNQYDDNNNVFNGNNNTAAATLSYSPKLYQKYYNDYREGILEIAKTLLYKKYRISVDCNIYFFIRELRSLLQVNYVIMI